MICESEMELLETEIEDSFSMNTKCFNILNTKTKSNETAFQAQVYHF